MSDLVFRKRAPVRGDPRVALETAATILAGQGFRIERSPSTLRAISPGFYLARQHPNHAASEIRIDVGPGEIELTANLNRLRFCTRWIVGSLLVISGLHGAFLWKTLSFMDHSFTITAVGPFLFFLLFIFTVCRIIPRRIKEGLRTLVENVAAAADARTT